MSADLERAMTRYGDGTACERPIEIRNTAARVMAWGTQPETCKSCVANPVVAIVGGLALCAGCRAQRSARVATIDGLSRAVMRRGEPTAGGGFRGHAIVFDKWSLDLGGFIERVRPEAVNRTLNTGHDVHALWNHNSDNPIGRLSARTMSIWKDSAGLASTIVPPAWGAKYIETVGRGDVSGMSFGFRMLEDEWQFDGKIPTRDLTDLIVKEISAVAFPAYPDTDIRVDRDVRAEAPNRVQMLQRWHRTRMAR